MIGIDKDSMIGLYIVMGYLKKGRLGFTLYKVGISFNHFIASTPTNTLSLISIIAFIR